MPKPDPNQVVVVGTCDWGNCDGRVVGMRLAEDGSAWLSVCDRHYIEAPARLRVHLDDLYGDRPGQLDGDDPYEDDEDDEDWDDDDEQEEGYAAAI